MQLVNVLGVSNPMQFPDDMDISDIRDFLRKKFTKQMVEGTQPRDLDPLQGQARATEQSLAEKAGQGISNALYDSGIISDRYGAQRIGENVTSIGEFLPVIGDATAGDEFGRALKQGDGVGMAIGALGAIPLIGDAAKKAVKLKPHQVSPTSKEWSEFDFDEINREAFGVTESDVTKLSPSELNIKWTDDLDNVEYEIKNSGKTRKEWAEGVDLSTPIDVIIEDGVYKIDDGHHRYSAAKILGKDLPVSLQINDQPFVGLAKRATERGEEVHPAIMKAAVDRGFKPSAPSTPSSAEMLGGGELGDAAKKSIKVYHGTPFKYDSPNLENYGSGEGGEGFGYGFHTSASPRTADNYATPSPLIEIDGMEYWGNQPENAIAKSILDDGYSKTLADVKGVIERKGETDFLARKVKMIESLKGASIVDKRSKGVVKEFLISDSDLNSFIDFDKGINEQSDAVASALREAGLPTTGGDTGEDFYYEIAEGYGGGTDGDREASEFLDSIGVRGIKYKDSMEGQYMGDSGNYSNYTIFNPSNLNKSPTP